MHFLKNLKHIENDIIERDKVEDLFNKYGTLNPFKLCQRLDIKILSGKLGSKEAILVKHDGKFTFIINNKSLLRMQHLACAKLLGHALLFPDISENQIFSFNRFYISMDHYSMASYRFVINLFLYDKKNEELNILTSNAFSVIYGIYLSFFSKIIY